MTCSVEDFKHARLVIDDGLFAIGIFDSRVVGLDEMVETELDGERGFTYTTVAENDEFVDHHLATHVGQ